MRLCIVSPHLDDAVLSCGIAMQRVVAGGGDVTVLNIFSAGTNGDNRRVEDEKAVAHLGGRSIFLDELDAPDRDARYKSEIQLFHGDFANVPASFVGHIAARIEDVLQRESIDHVIFPLAAGTHIDHRIAFAAAQRLSRDVTYYEDRPYILWSGMLQARMNQLACAAEGLPVVIAQDMEAGLDRYHYLSHFVPPGQFRNECLPRYYADLVPPINTKLRGTSTALEATAEEITRLYDSLAFYTSQMPFIYPSREVFLRDSHAHEMTRSGTRGYVERAWTLTLAY